MSELNELPEGYIQPLCRPLTRRVMRGGVPYNVFVILIMALMIGMIQQVYIVFVLVPLAFVAARKSYELDDYFLDIWWMHARQVINRRTHLEL